jgi:putative tricarboxylic transport membrane protein
MNTQRKSWRALIGSLAAFTAFALPQASAHAASWSPEKNVEIIVTTGPGGAQDRTARVMQRILQKGQYTPVPITVLNKPGGGGAIGLAYLNLHPGDGQYLLTTSPTILANHILGKSKVT